MKKLITIVGIVSLTLGLLYGFNVKAQTSYLDVKAGDTNSYLTLKDTIGWDNYYWVTPQTCVGDIHTRSISQNGQYKSVYFPFYYDKGQTRQYGYNPYSAPGGLYYRIESYGSPNNWHLTGRYTP